MGHQILKNNMMHHNRVLCDLEPLIALQTSRLITLQTSRLITLQKSRLQNRLNIQMTHLQTRQSKINQIVEQVNQKDCNRQTTILNIACSRAHEIKRKPNMFLLNKLRPKRMLRELIKHPIDLQPHWQLQSGK